MKGNAAGGVLSSVTSAWVALRPLSILGLGIACKEDELSRSKKFNWICSAWVMRGESLIDWLGMGFLWFIVRKFGWNVVGVGYERTGFVSGFVSSDGWA